MPSDTTKPRPATLTEWLRRWEPSGALGRYERRSDRLTIESLANLRTRVSVCAQVLRDSDFRAGETVIIAASTQVDTLSAFLGAIAAGARPAVVPFRPSLEEASRSTERLNNAARAFSHPPLVLGTHSASKAAGVAGLRFTPIPDVSADSQCGPLEVQAAEPGSISHLQFSSGSTGIPKVVAVSHEAAVANIFAIVDDLEISRTDSMVTWLPLYHDMGLVVGCLTPLLASADLYLLSTFDFLRDPFVWMRLISDCKATLTCGPDFALRSVTKRLSGLTEPDIDLSTLRRLICGGEPVNTSTLDRFARALRPFGFDPTALAPSYGLAEATVYVSSSPLRTAPVRLVADRTELATGGPVTTARTEPLDEGWPPLRDDEVDAIAVGAVQSVRFGIHDLNTGEALSEDRCGEIVVYGPSVAAGYLSSGGEVLRFSSSGLHTGDLGLMHGGQLYVVDRIKDVIIWNGQNFCCSMLERALCDRLDQDYATAVIFEADQHAPHGRVVAVIEATDGEEATALLRRARQSVAGLDVPISDLVIVKERSLPRTTSGKKQHTLVRQRWLDGDLIVLTHHRTMTDSAPPADVLVHQDDAPSSMTADRRILTLVQQAASACGCTAPITPLSHLMGDLLIDSLALFELVVRIESDFGVHFNEESLAGLETVKDLTELVERTLSIQQPSQAPARGGHEYSVAIERLFGKLPGLNLVAAAQSGRQIYVNSRWMTDFASCNYLGFDVEPRIAAAIMPLVRQFGTHPSWTRAVASPEPYRRLESRLAELVAADDTVVFPTISLLHFGVLPRLAGLGGAILIDSAAHHSLQQAAVLARGQGSIVTSWQHGQLDELERCLRATAASPTRVIAVDGVYSMSGAIVDLPGIVALADSYDAVVYVDDAHGFGIVGEQPTNRMPYGVKGNGVVQYHGINSDRIIYVAGLSKAFSSLGAFVTCGSRYGRRFFEEAGTMIFSGPVPVASLATALAGLDLNLERGDDLRRQLLRITRRLTDGLADAGFDPRPHSDLPIINVELGDPPLVRQAAETLWEAGIIVTPSIFPAMPLRRGGIRFTTTAINTDREIDNAIAAMRRVQTMLSTTARTLA